MGVGRHIDFEKTDPPGVSTAEAVAARVMMGLGGPIYPKNLDQRMGLILSWLNSANPMEAEKLLSDARRVTDTARENCLATHSGMFFSTLLHNQRIILIETSPFTREEIALGLTGAGDIRDKPSPISFERSAYLIALAEREAAIIKYLGATKEQDKRHFHALAVQKTDKFSESYRGLMKRLWVHEEDSKHDMHIRMQATELAKRYGERLAPILDKNGNLIPIPEAKPNTAVAAGWRHALAAVLG